MKLIQQTTIKIIICFFMFVSSSIAATQHAKLIDYVFLGQFNKETAKLAMQKVPPLSSLEMNYSLNLYKIHYNTPAPNGKMALASGLVAMPIAPQKSVGIVSYFHGTRIVRTEVPSSNDERNAVYLATFGNSGGYMLVMPDYLGLGDSDVQLHPYIDSKTLASSSIDMLLAAKELAADLNYPINDQLFLAGYSEGGFTTNVVYEEILKNYPQLHVTATAPGSAPYDWDETMQFIVKQPGPRASTYLAYFFYSMQTFNHYWSGLNEIFNKPYNTLVPILYDGKHSNKEVLEALPADPREIVNESVLNAVINGNDAHSAELKMNFNHYDFVATSPMLMIGTKGDHDVPYHGAEIAYEVLKSKSDKVYIQSVSDVLDHIQAFPVVTRVQLEFFNRYAL